MGHHVVSSLPLTTEHSLPILLHVAATYRRLGVFDKVTEAVKSYSGATPAMTTTKRRHAVGDGCIS
jgi:hypothetical protein